MALSRLVTCRLPNRVMGLTMTGSPCHSWDRVVKGLLIILFICFIELLGDSVEWRHMSLLSEIKKWWCGKFIPFDDDKNNSNTFIWGGYDKRPLIVNIYAWFMRRMPDNWNTFIKTLCTVIITLLTAITVYMTCFR